mmetsp:Transcript_23219/g.62204  ORF Transcript_23219/g.62204 Transcript_23219/m.62204 type:complete len:313 (-) Transcript_23219:1184-2122(-)
MWSSTESEIRYLRKQPTIDCETDSYELFRIFCCVLIGAYASILVSYYVLLRRRRDRILLCDDASLELRHATRYDPVLRPFMFLIRPYKREFYYWDTLDMLRRIFFCSILPLFGEPSEKAGIGCVLSIMSLMVQSNLKPYEKAVTNALSEACQYLIFFVFFTALATQSKIFREEDEGWSALGATCLASNMIVFVVSFRPGVKVLLAYRATEQKLRQSIADASKSGRHDDRLDPLRLKALVKNSAEAIDGPDASAKWKEIVEKHHIEILPDQADGVKRLRPGLFINKVRALGRLCTVRCIHPGHTVRAAPVTKK